MKNIGEKIREVREKKNFTQQQMADELEITPNGYGKIERGESSVSFDKLQKIAQLLKVQLAELVDLDKSVVGLKDTTIENINDIKIASIIICEVSEKERELYEGQISQLKDENLYLRSLVEKLTTK